MEKNLMRIATVAVFLLFGFLSPAQTGSFNKDGFKITRTIRKVGDITVVVSQSKSLKNTDPLCTAVVRILKKDRQIDSLVFNGDQLDAVGDRYGLLIYDELILNHVVISKFGSYDGKTIIVNGKGQKFITSGGFSSLDQSKGLLFSSHHSDVSGFSVFDLNTDKEIYFKEMGKDRVQAFYKMNDKYFVETNLNDPKQPRYWQIDLANKRLTETNLKINAQAERLKELADYCNGTTVSCE